MGHAKYNMYIEGRAQHGSRLKRMSRLFSYRALSATIAFYCGRGVLGLAG